ncbi:hypothetical protein [Nitrosomonas sp.]|uniref:hypothetical protein n=1 Tax=Nitrosomonas sp. TaxID=42353 RepID=UPI0027306162|nr:hypothetical protein [Nitrosomonas sp.]MDP1786147.1 hypothetical protein [Nitrosomonas sp.]
MKYQLTLAILDPHQELEIDKERFDFLKRARHTLIEALALEEKYEILISNYLELEQQIVRQAVVAQVRTQSDYSEFFEFRMIFNVALVNLLTAARLYVDQFPRHVRDCLADESQLALAKSWLNQAYDSAFEYRFMEALRNHVQHNGVPLHWWSVGSKRTDKGLREFSVSLCAEKKHLAEDTEFKKTVLAECDEKVDLLFAARVYMQSLSEVHSKARDAISNSVAIARLAVQEEQDRYQSSSSGTEDRLLGLEAQAVENDRIIERVPLLLQWDDVRKKLQMKNPLLRNISNSFASGRSRSN